MPFSGIELVVVLVIVLIIFGAGKLPQVFSALGKGVREFRDASEGKEEAANTNAAATVAPPPTETATQQPAPPAGETTQKTG